MSTCRETLCIILKSDICAVCWTSTFIAHFSPKYTYIYCVIICCINAPKHAASGTDNKYICVVYGFLQLIISLVPFWLVSVLVSFIVYHHHHHHHVIELGHLLTRSGLTYPEVSSKVCHNSFCQLDNCVSLPWVIYYEEFYLHVVSSFSCIPVICPEFVLFLIPL